MSTDVSLAVLPASLQANPRLSTWLRLTRDGHAWVSSGKVELGQGILGALSQIVAEELGIRVERVRMTGAVTGASPDEAVTSGSLSVQHSGAALRHVCAQARALHLARAAALHAVDAQDVAALEVVDGEIRLGDRRLSSYWDLAEDEAGSGAGTGLLDVDAVPGVATRPAAAYTVVGRAQPRADIADKVFGEFVFIHDLVLPRMAHGRVVRPPSPDAVLEACDEDAARALDGVLAVLRDGSQLGVVAETETLAERAAAKLAASCAWIERESLPDADALRPWLRSLPSTALELRQGEPAPGAVRTLRASYDKPFIRHAAIGPSCALARSEGEALEVWTHSQAIYNLRRDLGLAFGLPAEEIRVRHVQGAGCYGHNGADDVAYDAAAPAPAAPCACSGRAPTSCAGRPSARRWPSTSKPTSTPPAGCSPGATARGAPAMACVPAAAPRRRCWAAGIWPSPSSASPPSTRRARPAVAAIATPSRSMPSHRTRWCAGA